MKKGLKKGLIITGIIIACVSLAFNVFVLYQIEVALKYHIPDTELGDGFTLSSVNNSIYAPFDKVKDGEKLDIQYPIENYTAGPKHIIAKHNLHGHAPRIDRVKKGSSSESVYGKTKFLHGWDCDYYWIIEKETCKILGPYNLDEFNVMCDSLGVNLQFDLSREKKRVY